MSYIGNEPFSVAFLTDTFSGNGSTTAFTLSAAPAGTSSILVAITGVVQDPSTYSVVGTTLTFSPAPPTGTGNISVRFLGIPASGVTTTAYRTVTEFTATAGQTTFSVPSYTPGFIDVYRNGVMLGSADYTASNGLTVVLASGATAGDLVEVISFSVSSVLNAIPGTAGSVGNTFLADNSVSTAKIQDNAITTAKIAAGAVVQADLATGVAGTGPAFWCSPGADTTISSATDVVIANSSETYDTASCFNNTGSTVGGIPAYAFLPNVAGFYLFTSTINTELSTSPTRFINSVRINGATAYRVVDTSVGYAPSVSTGSILLYMNGTTDYVQQIIYLAASTPRYSASITTARFSGFLVRAA